MYVEHMEGSLQNAARKTISTWSDQIISPFCMRIDKCQNDKIPNKYNNNFFDCDIW